MRDEPRRDRAALERTRDVMNKATRDCLVAGYEAPIPSLASLTQTTGTFWQQP